MVLKKQNKIKQSKNTYKQLVCVAMVADKSKSEMWATKTH